MGQTVSKQSSTQKLNKKTSETKIHVGKECPSLIQPQNPPPPCQTHTHQHTLTVCWPDGQADKLRSAIFFHPILD